MKDSKLFVFFLAICIIISIIGYINTHLIGWIIWPITTILCILNLVLFFKVWGMTNDVRELKEFFIKKDATALHTSCDGHETSDNFADQPQPADQQQPGHDGAKSDAPEPM